jgi:tetratricopeptide (TPR) repeat protein
VNAEPTSIKSLFNLAEMYARDGVFSKAEFYYNMILRHEKVNSSATFMLGMLFMGRGMYDEAEKRLLEVTELEPEFADSYVELSVLMAIKGDHSRAEDYLKKADSISVNDKTELDFARFGKRISSIKRMQELCCDN